NTAFGAPLGDLTDEVLCERGGAKPVKGIARRDSVRANVVPHRWIVVHGRIPVLLLKFAVKRSGPHTPVEPMHGGLIVERHLYEIPEIPFELIIEALVTQLQEHVHGV